MSAACTADILIAAADIDDRLLGCMADCRATLVRTFEEAQRALRERLFKMILIDLNFDNVRMFDLLQHVRSLSAFNGVPVLCVQGSDAAAGLSAALDRLVRRVGGKAFIDLRGGDEAFASAFQRLQNIVAVELEADTTSRPWENSQHGNPLCILIIDHDVDAAHRLGEMLEGIGHDVDFAYDGLAGLDAARRLRPDVVFMDVAVARMDGYQVARRLRRELGLRNGLLVGLGAALNEEEHQCMRAAGFDHHIVKPAGRPSIEKLLHALTGRPTPP